MAKKAFLPSLMLAMPYFSIWYLLPSQITFGGSEPNAFSAGM